MGRDKRFVHGNGDSLEIVPRSGTGEGKWRQAWSAFGGGGSHGGREGKREKEEITYIDDIAKVGKRLFRRHVEDLIGYEEIPL
jgi:hypothetical protein